MKNISKKIVIGLVLTTLITTGFSSIGARVIMDSSDTISTMITNSKGNSWTATAANLQLAIWDLNGTGGTVSIPPGTLSIANAIRLSGKGHVTIEGHNTTLRQTAGSSDSTFEFSNCNNITITGIIIDGQKSLQVYGSDIYKQHGITLRNGNKDITIDNCNIYDTLGCGIFIYNVGSKNIVIRDNTLLNCGDVTQPNRDGIFVAYCDNIKINGNTLINSYANNIAVSASRNVLVENNFCNGTINSTGVSSITVYNNQDVIINANHVLNTVGDITSGCAISAEGNPKITISNNIIDSFWWQGIYLSWISPVVPSGSYFSITGNIINGSSGNEKYGILIQNARNGTISGNSISNIVGTNTYGILLTDLVHSVSVNANSIYNCDFGLTEGSTCHDDVFSDNILKYLTAYGLYIQGDNTSWTDNHLYSADTGIYETSDGDYNTISGNKIHGSVLAINKAGGAHSTYAGNYNTTSSSWYSNITVDDVLRLHGRTTKPSPASTGQIYYNLTDSHLYSYLGGSWIALDSGSILVDLFKTKWNLTSSNLLSWAPNWNSTRSALSTYGPSWNSTRAALSTYGPSWNSTRSSLSTNGPLWNTTKATVTTYGPSWNSTRSAVSTYGPSWNSTRSSLSSYGPVWNATQTFVLAHSAAWNITGGSGDALVPFAPGWNNTRSSLITNGPLWNYTRANLLASSPLWNITRSALSTYGPSWNSTRAAVSTYGPSWNSTRSAVSTYGPVWNATKIRIDNNEAAWNTTGSWTNTLLPFAPLWNTTKTNLVNYGVGWNTTKATVTTNAPSWNYTRANLLSSSPLWNATRSLVLSKSAAWNASGTNTLLPFAPNWNSTRTTLTTYSPNWNATRTLVLAKSNTWNTTATNLVNYGLLWNASKTNLVNYGLLWNQTRTLFNLYKTNWNATSTQVTTWESTWNASGTAYTAGVGLTLDGTRFNMNVTVGTTSITAS